MKKLILIMGHLAAGKSTFAKKLADELNAMVLIKDEIKEILGDDIGFNNREENLKLSFATFDIMKYVFINSIVSCNILILESNFRMHEVEKLNEIAKANKIDVINFVLSADPNLLLARYIKRNENRHIVHTSVGLADPEKFLSTLVDFKKYPLIGQIINVDTSDFDKIDYEHYIRAINN